MINKINKILHIIPHLGGGAGRVLANYLCIAREDHSYSHRVATLDFANPNASNILESFGVVLSDEMAKKPQQLIELIEDSDVVLIHWWNHPLLYDFIVRYTFPPCRLIMWSHVSGNNPPYVFTDKVLNFSDLFIFTTPLSWQTKKVKDLSEERLKNISVIWSTSGVEYVRNVQPKKHEGFNVGYIGTVDYAKMHFEFLNICDKINIPNIKFIVCGGPKEKEIQQEAENLGIANKFEFMGEVKNISNYLSIFDVFGYPLNPNHYGTCDQVLAESMAAGVVPVVLSNPMESNMIKDNITGLVAQNIQGYVEAIMKLYQDADLRQRLSDNGREYAVKNFSIENMVNLWNKVFKKINNIPKSVKVWPLKNSETITAKDVFLESLGEDGLPFINYCEARTDLEINKASVSIKKLAESPNWQSLSKGTVHQYLSFFPGDEYLLKWSAMMK